MQKPHNPHPQSISSGLKRSAKFMASFTAWERNSKCTEELVARICRHLERYGGSDEGAALMCQVVNWNLARWKQERPELQTRFNAARLVYCARTIEFLRSVGFWERPRLWNPEQWMRFARDEQSIQAATSGLAAQGPSEANPRQAL